MSASTWITGCIFFMIQPQGFESRLKAMNQMKSQENKSCNIEDHKGQYLEFIDNFSGEIVI